jgi:GrpB-like predicted nucleotidyltransferase (UPF0157 family)
VLGHRALRIEHTGSTAVPGLVAKPIINMLLVVIDSADEDAYLQDMVAADYVLRIRGTNWFEHRMFNGPGSEINLHVFSSGCPEIDRMLMFRDRLRSNDPIAICTYALSSLWPSKYGSMSRITPMPRPPSSRRSSHGPALIEKNETSALTPE